MNDSGPDHHEETEGGTQLMGEDPNSLLDLMHCSDTQMGYQGSGGKRGLEHG